MQEHGEITSLLGMLPGLLAMACLAMSCDRRESTRPATLLVALPDSCNTPNAMALLPDNSIILTVPNFIDEKAGTRLMRITPDNQAEEFHVFPYPYPGLTAPHDRIFPLGIARAANGDLYIADAQCMIAMKQKSRIWRLALKNGKVEKMVLVAQGLNVANGLAIRNDSLYVTESVLTADSDPLQSAVLRFDLAEENVTLQTPLKDDPHVLTVFAATTPNSKKWGFGADGIAFDSKGNLFVGLFGDGVVHKIRFDAAGKVAANEPFARAPGKWLSCDGMSADPRTDILYVSDLANNAVHAVHPDGTVETLSGNDHVADKRSGLLVNPCETLVRGDSVVVVNMDWPCEGYKNEKIPHRQPATLSVIRLADPTHPATSRARGAGSSN